MSIFTQSAKATPTLCKSRRITDKLPGHWFAGGFVFFRPEACRQLCHFDVLGALLRHHCGSLGELSPADVADETRPMDFLTEHSAHFHVSECLHLSAFRDHHGTKFYLLTLTDFTTVVSLPEEF